MKLKVTEQMLFVGAAAIAAGIVTKQLAKKFPGVLTQPVAGALLTVPALFLFNESDTGRGRDLNLILLGLMAGGLASGIDGVGGIGAIVEPNGNRPVQINVHR
jgi:hypothetical protein